jgi:predicted nucleic acid-binding protein
MPDNIFVDTNVLVYARDASEPQKQPKASDWLTFLWENRRGRLSYQVLQEFYATVTEKLRPGLEIQGAREDIKALLAWNPLPVDTRVIENGWNIQDRYRLSWWDSLIVAAALVAGCRYLLTEDLQESMKFDTLQVINPFLHPPASLF